MTIEVEVFGQEQVPKHKSNITSYSYSEEATPISPGDSSGGVGTLSFSTLDEDTTSALIFRDEIYLTDTHNGEISGKVISVSGSDGEVSFNGVSNLSRLNIIKTIPAFNSTLGELITYIFQEAGILSGFDIATSIETIPVISPAYTGDLWVLVKDICTAYEFEIALVKDIIYIRELRQNTIKVFDTISEGWDISDISPSQYVDVNYYNYEYHENFLAYPRGGWTPETQVYQVDANQELVVEIPLEAYLESIEQPVVVASVGRYDTSASVYCVSGNDGLPIAPAAWENGGGSLTAELADNGQTIVVTINGANILNLAPFRIAVNAGPSDAYSSLRIIGTGIFYDMQTVHYPTGLTEEDTSSIIGATIDNKFIDTQEQAFDAAKRAVIDYAIPNQIYNFSAPNIGDFISVPATVIYTDQFGEYDAYVGTEYDIVEMDSDNAGKTFAQFDASLPNTVVSDGSSQQLFGNVAGARVKFRDSWYRVKSATITPTQVDASSEWDNLFSDLNSQNAGKTFTSFNSAFNDLTFTDFSIIPMRTV